MTAYEMNEIARFRRELAEVDRAPLADRKQAQQDFHAAMRDTPELVAERVSWMIDGNYGEGAMFAAKREMGRSRRANKVASLTQMVAAIEWHCPPRAAAAAWKKLSAAQQEAIDREVQWVIDQSVGGDWQQESEYLQKKLKAGVANPIKKAQIEARLVELDERMSKS